MCWECKPKIELTIMSAAEAQSPLWFISHWCGPCASSVMRVFCRYVLWARPLWIIGAAVTCVVGPTSMGGPGRYVCCGPGQYWWARPLRVLWARPVWIGAAVTSYVWARPLRMGPAVTDFVRRVWTTVRHLARATRELCLGAPMIASVCGRAEHK